jgi:hypothetical protein
VNRRRFIQAAGSLGLLRRGYAASRDVSIVVDPSDPVASSGPAQWAIKELEESLAKQGIPSKRFDRLQSAPGSSLCVVAADASAAIVKSAGVTVPSAPESLAIVSTRSSGRNILLASGRDTRGLVYALLELADRARNDADLVPQSPIVEQPANKIRSIARLFTSDVEDKPWFNDREMWPQYLTMLATNRFNRFHLAFGIGYDFLTRVTDAYFLFAYPFLLNVPGYSVRVPELPDTERDSNLAMLRYISDQAAARGIHFQLGLWMHGYKWIDSPHPHQTIEGLTAENHGPYCRDAVRALLQACPAIGGVTFRVHGESGVEEGSYQFWKTVFQGVATCGRRVEIDMHSKGMDQTMLDLGVSTGLPLKLSPKYWAEHMGMPYMQADIRDQERPDPTRKTSALMKLSAGSRSFLRYGYGDLLREDRKCGVLHRIWPGTQRLLMWGDPVTAAAHARNFRFCGSEGVDICEPLSFKGRRGSGIPGDRCAYANTSLRTRWDWQKYEYGYRVWGRLVYNPDSDPEPWRRYLRNQFGAGVAGVEEALASASRILPIVTTAHMPSAANNNYWPELYLNQSLIDADHFAPYSDTTQPRVFGNASPLDPQLFSRMNEFGEQLVNRERSAKYSPIEVAQWLEDYADAARKSLAQAQVRERNRPEFRRLEIDVLIQAGLGSFFASKFRAGVLYRIHELTGDRTALEESLSAYRKARAAWADLANRAKGVYLPDITVGEHPQLHGHWLDRLPAIDRDINALAAKLAAAPVKKPEPQIEAAIQEALRRPPARIVQSKHSPPQRFERGRPLDLEFTTANPSASVRLLYRHVNQAERFESVAMDRHETRFRAVIPSSYTESAYPLQYYFEVREGPESAAIYPGFSPRLDNQPYYVVRSV